MLNIKVKEFLEESLSVKYSNVLSVDLENVCVK